MKICDKPNKVIRNASWLIGVRIVQSILSFLIGSMTARYLGPSNYGLIGYATSIVTFVIPIMQLGLTAILVQELVHNPDDEGKILGTAHMMSMASAILCMISVIALVMIVNIGETETIIVCALYSISLLCQSFELIQYWFQSKYLAKYSSVVMLFAFVVVSVYRIFLLVEKKSVYWFALSHALDYFLIALGLHVIYRKMGGQKFVFSFDYAKSLFSKGKYYIISGLMVTVFAQTARILLKLFLDNAATGYYSAAVTCASVTGFVFTAIIDSVRPAILESHKQGKEVFEKNVARTYCIIIYLSLIQSLFMTVLAKPIVFILYGEAYEPAIAVLRLIVWYTAFSYIGSIRNIWILAEGKYKYIWIINLSGAIFNIILNLIFIPIWGIIGASFVSLVTQVFTNFIIGYIIKPIRENNKLIIRGLDVRLIYGLLQKVVFRKQK